LLVALARRLLLRPVLEVGAKAEVGVLPAFSYSVIYALYECLVPCGCTGGKGEGLGVRPARLGLVSLLRREEAKLAVKAARAASRPACLIRLSLAFVGRTMLLFLVFGRVGQLL
jgi:hypothetical protein